MLLKLELTYELRIAALYQRLVNPAKLFGRVAYVIRAQRLFDDLHGDGSG